MPSDELNPCKHNQICFVKDISLREKTGEISFGKYPTFMGQKTLYN